MPVGTDFVGGLSLTEANALLKEYYEPAVRVQFNSDTVLWYMLNKNSEGVSGREVVYSLNTARSEGYGFIRAGDILPDPHNQTYTKMEFPMSYFYIRIGIDGPVMAASRDSAGAFARGLQAEIEGGVRDGKNRLNEAVFNDGSGRLALIGGLTDLANGVIQVKHPFDTVGATGQTTSDWFGHLREGMWISIVNDTTTVGTALDFLQLPATLTQGQKALYVMAVDKDAKTITLSDSDATPLTAFDLTTLESSDTSAVRAPEVGFALTRVVLRDSSYSGWAGTTVTNETWLPFTEYRGNSTTATDKKVLMGLSGIVSDADVFIGYAAGAAVTTSLQGVAASNSYWRSTVLDNSGTGRAISIALLQRAQDSMEREGNATLNLIVTSYGGRRAYENLLISDKRYVNTLQLDGGFTALDFNGKPMVVEKDCPLGNFYFLDLAAIEVKRQADLAFMDKDGAILQRVPNRDAYEATMFMYCELATPRRNALAVLRDINEG